VIVVDASAVIELLLNTQLGQRVAERIAPTDVTLHAPHLIELEVAQVMRRFVAAGTVGIDRSARAIDALRQLDIARYAHEPFLARIWSLRQNLTAYDAAYVSLTETLGATLLTCDGKLAGAPGHVARIEVLVADDT
jgi:predicted nucleic acid-binding protein